MFKNFCFLVIVVIFSMTVADLQADNCSNQGTIVSISVFPASDGSGTNPKKIVITVSDGETVESYFSDDQPGLSAQILGWSVGDTIQINCGDLAAACAASFYTEVNNVTKNSGDLCI